MQWRYFKSWAAIHLAACFFAAGANLQAQELTTQQVRPSTNAFLLDSPPTIDGDGVALSSRPFTDVLET